jgi:predicted Zn-dependent protease
MAARRCLSHPNLESGAHASAWMILAESSLRIGEPVQAQEALEQLIEICREPENWVLLAQARLQAGDPRGALVALLQAEEASPFRPDIHEYLSQLYQGLGQTPESDRHRRRASYLRQHAAQR